LIPLNDLLKRTAAFLMLPLSLVPIYLALPRLKAEFGSPEKEIVRAPLPPVNVSFSAQEVRGFRPLSVNRNAIPVLAYHGINSRNDVYSVSRRTFASHVEMLHRAGFRTISMQQYIRFLSGDRKGLPPRPILITFDDGRLDSYRGADKLLARFDFRATMFVIARSADEGGRFYLDWDDLRRMAASGRWDIQEHAGDGHHNIRHQADGETGPFYAFRRWTKDGMESFDAYRRRVAHDVLWGMRKLRKEIPGYAPFSFALPYGNYGQLETNDPRIPAFFNRFLLQHFRAVFVVKPGGYTTPKTPRGRIGRIEIHTYTTAGRLYNTLREKLPTAAGELRIPPVWCRPGWRCVPEERYRPPAAAGLTAVPAAAGTQAAPPAGGGVAPSAGARPRPAPADTPVPADGAEPPIKATGAPTPGR
jgi:peptidoglycan/xylan/chitin deacetylase (PgdA/CDA1 family)